MFAQRNECNVINEKKIAAFFTDVGPGPDHLHPSAGDDDEDDGGVAQDSREGDGAIEDREQHHEPDLQTKIIIVIIIIALIMNRTIEDQSP